MDLIERFLALSKMTVWHPEHLPSRDAFVEKYEEMNGDYLVNIREMICRRVKTKCALFNEELFFQVAETCELRPLDTSVDGASGSAGSVGCVFTGDGAVTGVSAVVDPVLFSRRNPGFCPGTAKDTANQVRLSAGGGGGGGGEAPLAGLPRKRNVRGECKRQSLWVESTLVAPLLLEYNKIVRVFRAPDVYHLVELAAK